jgi:hypothetical protein
VNILNGKAEAEIFLNLDTFASLTANVDGKIDLSKTIQTRRIVDSRALPGYPSNHIGHAGSAMYKPKKDENKIEARALPIPSRIGFAGRPTSNERRDFGANINGCIGMTTGVSGDVGATGKFFSLFDGTTKQNLFKKEFQLFNVSLMLRLFDSTQYNADVIFLSTEMLRCCYAQALHRPVALPSCPRRTPGKDTYMSFDRCPCRREAHRGHCCGGRYQASRIGRHVLCTGSLCWRILCPLYTSYYVYLSYHIPRKKKAYRSSVHA